MAKELTQGARMNEEVFTNRYGLQCDWSGIDMSKATTVPPEERDPLDELRAFGRDPYDDWGDPDLRGTAFGLLVAFCGAAGAVMNVHLVDLADNDESVTRARSRVQLLIKRDLTELRARAESAVPDPLRGRVQEALGKTEHAAWALAQAIDGKSRSDLICDRYLCHGPWTASLNDLYTAIEQAQWLIGLLPGSEAWKRISGEDETVPAEPARFPDPIANAELARRANCKDADHMSESIREALGKEGRALKPGGPGIAREWTHVQLRAAYAHLPKGKLRRFLDKSGFANPEQT